MIPQEKDLKFCILNADGSLMDGPNGLAIGETEQDAWERAIEPAEPWAIEKAKHGYGCKVRRCAIMVINP